VRGSVVNFPLGPALWRGHYDATDLPLTGANLHVEIIVTSRESAVLLLIVVLLISSYTLYYLLCT
jgi:hypothetical protein